MQLSRELGLMMFRRTVPERKTCQKESNAADMIRILLVAVGKVDRERFTLVAFGIVPGRERRVRVGPDGGTKRRDTGRALARF